MENEEKISTVIESDIKEKTAIERLKNKKFILALGIFCILIIIAFIAILVINKTKPSSSNRDNATTSTTNANLSFLTDFVAYKSPTAERTVDFIINSPSVALSGVLLNLEYDPRFVQMKKFSLNNTDFSFFGNYSQIIQLATDQPPGKTTVSLLLPKEVEEKAGRGSIGTFTFTTKNLKPGEATTISISPNSALIKRNGTKTPLTTRPLVISRQ